MLRTNTKKARQNVRAYIVENFGTEYNPEATDYEAIAEAIRQAFNDEMVKHDRSRATHAALFVRWAQGLPSALETAPYYLGDARQIVGDILEETAEERARFTERQAEELMTRLIYRELFASR